MAVNDNLITLVIHTEERAVKLKQILESHDIKVVLEDVSLPGVPLGAPVKKVRISIDSLSLGLKILESGDLTASPLSIFKLTGRGKPWGEIRCRACDTALVSGPAVQSVRSIF